MNVKVLNINDNIRATNKIKLDIINSFSLKLNILLTKRTYFFPASFF